MKIKIFAAALAALALGAAASASAQDFAAGYGGAGGYNAWAGADWRGNQQIVVRQDGRTMSFDRGDRMFYRLTDRPFNFRPGLAYAYTDQCNRFGCRVVVFSPRMRRVVDQTFAPRLFDRWQNWDQGQNWGQNRDRDGDHRFDHGGYDGAGGGDGGPYGAPRR
jgi:hypothetical protein